MDRSPVFSAIKALRAGKSFTSDDVLLIDNLLTALGIAHGDGITKNEVQIGLMPQDFQQVAHRLGCSVAQIQAVWEVESGGGWYKDVRADILALDGRGGFLDGPHLPKILFEAHVFDRFTEGRFRASHPNLSSAKWNTKLYVGGQGEYTRLWSAMKLDHNAALLSASVGGAQIMGFNHQAAGFATVLGFWDAMKVSERAHLDAFGSFITSKKLNAALKNISTSPATCAAFAKGYNGGGYATHNYHGKIAKAYAKYA